MNKSDVVGGTYLCNNSGVRHVPSLTVVGNEENEVAGFDLSHLYFITHLRLLPGDPGHFQTHRRKRLADQPRTVDTIIRITARLVRRAGVGTCLVDDLPGVLAYVRSRIDRF